jgi:hypothetical protein
MLAAGFTRVLESIGAYQSPTLPSSSVLSPIYSFLLNANPFILIILGGIVFFAGKLAKFVGIVIVIVGLISLLFPYLMKVV